MSGVNDDGTDVTFNFSNGASIVVEGVNSGVPGTVADFTDLQTQIAGLSIEVS